MQPEATLIYDGDCGFCTSSAAWIRARLRTPAAVASWQSLGTSRLTALGLTEADVAAAVQWIDARGTRRANRAVAAALMSARGAWPVIGAVIDFWPIRWLSASGYRVVARYRHTLPGSTDACRIPK